MKTALQDFNLLLRNLIDEPMNVIDSARPASLQVMFERLRLTNSAKWVPLNFANNPYDSQRLGAVMLNPPCKVFKTGLIKLQALKLIVSVRAKASVSR